MDIQRGKKLVEMALARQPQEDEGTENQINTLENASIVDDSVPSTSSGHVINVMSRAEIDFSSDDSVQDPHYQLPRMTPSSDSEESAVQHTVSPKKSVRILKREKKMKRNLGQKYKTLKGKVIPDRAMKELTPCRMKCMDHGEMKNKDFYESSSLLKSALVSRNKDTDGRQFKWLEKRWLRYEKEFGLISYKDTLCINSPFFIFNFKRRGSSIPDNIPIISMQPLPISKEKKKDLMDLLPLIPDIFHEFYVNLPTLDNLRNTDPDILEEEKEAIDV